MLLVVLSGRPVALFYFENKKGEREAREGFAPLQRTVRSPLTDNRAPGDTLRTLASLTKASYILQTQDLRILGRVFDIPSQIRHSVSYTSVLTPSHSLRACQFHWHLLLYAAATTQSSNRQSTTLPKSRALKRK